MAKRKKTSGYIYLLTNPALKPNWFKIGKTIRTPEERAAEISRATGVPMPYTVIHREQVADCHKAERYVHKALKTYRPRDNREFFVVPRQKAIQTMRKAAARFPMPGAAPSPTPRSPAIAALLELLPGLLFQTFGLGHIYAGRTQQGLVFCFGYWIVAMLNCAVAPKTWPWFGVWGFCWLITAVLAVNFAVRAARLRA